MDALLDRMDQLRVQRVLLAQIRFGNAEAKDIRHENVGQHLLVEFPVRNRNGIHEIVLHHLRNQEDERLSGTAALKSWTSGIPSVVFDADHDAASSGEVYLDCGPGVALTGEGKPFYVTVPAGTLAGGYRVEVFDSEGLAMVKYAKAHADSRVDRSELVQMPALSYSPAYKAAFLTAEAIGAYSNAASEGSLTSICTYVEGVDQYAYLNKEGVSRYLRLEDWDAGYALGFTMPYSLEAGKNCAVTLQSLGALPIASGTVENMRIVKLSDGKAWMLDRRCSRLLSSAAAST